MKLLLVTLLLLRPPRASPQLEENINYGLVSAWAGKLGTELWHFGEYISRRKEVQESFKSAQIELKDGRKLAEEIAVDINNMMQLKISAVRRICDTAESTAVSQQHSPPTPQNYTYYNSKEMYTPNEPPPTTPRPDEDAPPLPEDADKPPPPPKEIQLEPNQHFGGLAVNTSFSSVHVPTNVYDRSPNVIRAIRWSESLDDIFHNNYKMDPSLSWQYFGSSTGFMRHYPAMQWRNFSDPVDLFDCRTRAWYIEAASSSKDVVILIDSSGSMTGQRKDIARHVVFNILDTLGNNDFVNILYFNDTIHDVVPCFADALVQATMANVRELKLGLKNIPTLGIANFTAALTTAFELLKTYKDEKLGAHCNQAIMLVTDGVPSHYEEIFEEYNWEDKKNMSARVFTYLIGREVPDVRAVRWMACANRGYYVHLSTLAEVREQVLLYVPVMARPLVLWNKEHPIIWTPVYADIKDPKYMDYLWEEKECEEQKNLYFAYRRNETSKENQEKRTKLKRKTREDQHARSGRYRLMTSVSMPVFDQTENATRVANLLGVAGTDVPISDIQALMMPHQLGVNGYAFIVTNNGYILIHPDLRPEFQGILKPSYNSVDMIEVELMDDDGGPREFATELVQFREDVVNQQTGMLWMQVKYHYDNMKRVSRLRRQYFYTAIADSPFSLVVALPEPYGLSRVSFRPEEDIHRSRINGENITTHFSGRHWKVHPDWVYCKHHAKTFDTPEDELLFFLNRMVKTKWVWPLKPSPPEQTHGDRNLMQAVVFDARLTSWFSQNTYSKDDKGKEFIQRFGITETFMATHSGLTRWQSFSENDGEEFGKSHPRAVDEIWYRRAVEQHYMEPQSFVYSVDFDAGDEVLNENRQDDGPLVTATHAVFHRVGDQSAPAAVVGFQFHHSSLQALFVNITNNCGEVKPCTKTCKSEELECYVVDNNGYVLVSEKVQEAGRFFGEINSQVMQSLVDDKIFRQVRLVDYQAVCFEETDTNNPAPYMLTPLDNLRKILGHLMTYVLWLWHGVVRGDTMTSDQDDQGDFSQQPNGQDPKMDPGRDDGSGGGGKEYEVNRTRPTPCDREALLYQLQQHFDKEHTSPFNSPADGCDRPYAVQQIPGSNLILVVVDNTCGRDESSPPLTTAATKVFYNNSLACVRALEKPLYRRRLAHCIRHHPNESEIELCGDGNRPSASRFWHITLATLLTVLGSQILLPRPAFPYSP